jgi:hypothetical protein
LLPERNDAVSGAFKDMPKLRRLGVIELATERIKRNVHDGKKGIDNSKSTIFSLSVQRRKASFANQRTLFLSVLRARATQNEKVFLPLLGTFFVYFGLILLSYTSFVCSISLRLCATSGSNIIKRRKRRLLGYYQHYQPNNYEPLLCRRSP